MTTLVMLRGLGRDRRHWEGFDDKLRAQGVKVLCLDLPGNGTLAERKSPLRVEEYADELSHRLDTLGIGACVVLGISFGGMVALSLAARDKRVRAVWVLGSSDRHSPWFRRFSLPAVVFAGVTAAASVLRQRVLPDPRPEIGLVETAIVKLVSHQRGEDWELIARWSRLHQVACTSLGNMLRQLWAAWRFEAPPINCPSYFIHGKNDRLVHPCCSESLAGRYGAPVHYLPNGGHDLALDVQPQLLALLTDVVAD
ncbi:alpha/beta fold hydrolase [Shewanella sedimentimangrovi]|uniref:Alpha/beta hydrolase n=1 Tax=Shewanella sedimentimangrovi TaxID=2814293 RepID=A0ABX7R5A8_9GAMM|nr:alpha/beta hydrolase [Shewanella sedimentimangrovi]QSX38644.1 alpha/beta hydrolase [Shewanella sedimentimangrovi]